MQQEYKSPGRSSDKSPSADDADDRVSDIPVDTPKSSSPYSYFDNASILALGIGLPSYERLNSLVESGKVIATEKNGKVYVYWAPGWNAANWMKPAGSNTIFDILSKNTSSSGDKAGGGITVSTTVPYKAGGAIFSNKDMVR